MTLCFEERTNFRPEEWTTRRPGSPPHLARYESIDPDARIEAVDDAVSNELVLVDERAEVVEAYDT